MKTSETSKGRGQIWRQIAGIFALPAIGMYMLAYQILGKRCTYRWGNFDVTPLEPMSRNEHFFTRIFPSVVAILGIVIIMLIGYALGMPIN